MKLSIIIPAYNESAGITHTASKIRPVVKLLQETYEVELIFIDDGSSDSTGELLQKEFTNEDYARVISYKPNKGLGGAVRTGFKEAQGDIIVTTDFDGTYEFSTIPNILAYFDDQNVDLVTASPYHPQGGVEGVPRYRLLFSFGASLLYRILVHPRIHTWTALYRAYRRPVIESVQFENNGFLCNTEILINAINQGFKVKEFPTVLHTRQFGQSSIRIAKVTLSHFKYQWRLFRTSKSVGMVALALSSVILVLVFASLFVVKHSSSAQKISDNAL